MTNSEFIWSKGKLELSCIKKIIIQTLIVSSVVIGLAAIMNLLKINGEIFNLLCLVVLAIGELLIVMLNTITYRKKEEKLETFWRQDVNKEKAIEELKLLPGGDIRI